MSRPEEERKPMPQNLSEEAQNALNIAAALAPKMKSPFTPVHYIEPYHLVVGLLQQPSLRDLMVERGIDPVGTSDNFILMRPLFYDHDYNPQSGIGGHLNYRANFALTIASRLAERAGGQEISAMDMAKGIIIEDREYGEHDPLRTHEIKRFMGKTPGSMLELCLIKKGPESETGKKEKPNTS